MKMVFIGHYEHEESATCVMTSTRRIAKGRLVYHIFFKKSIGVSDYVIIFAVY